MHKLTQVPAEIFSIPERGVLREGWHADLVLFDLDRAQLLDPEAFRSKSKNSPFDDHPVQGKVCRTVVDGRTIFLADG